MRTLVASSHAIRCVPYAFSCHVADISACHVAKIPPITVVNGKLKLLPRASTLLPRGNNLFSPRGFKYSFATFHTCQMSQAASPGDTPGEVSGPPRASHVALNDKTEEVPEGDKAGGSMGEGKMGESKEEGKEAESSESAGHVAAVETLVQHVVVRKDLDWPLGSLIAQGCHVAVAAIWENREDELVKAYCGDMDHMHKVVLEVKGEIQLRNLSEKLKEAGIIHKLWVEQPENFATCLATKPYYKSQIAPHLKKLKLCK